LRESVRYRGEKGGNVGSVVGCRRVTASWYNRGWSLSSLSIRQFRSTSKERKYRTYTVDRVFRQRRLYHQCYCESFECRSLPNLILPGLGQHDRFVIPKNSRQEVSESKDSRDVRTTHDAIASVNRPASNHISPINFFSRPATRFLAL